MMLRTGRMMHGLIIVGVMLALVGCGSSEKTAGSEKKKTAEDTPVEQDSKSGDHKYADVSLPVTQASALTVTGSQLRFQFKNDGNGKVVVTEVQDDGGDKFHPIKPGDVIAEFESKEITAAENLRTYLECRKPGYSLSLKLFRGEEKIYASVKDDPVDVTVYFNPAISKRKITPSGRFHVSSDTTYPYLLAIQYLGHCESNDSTVAASDVLEKLYSKWEWASNTWARDSKPDIGYTQLSSALLEVIIDKTKNMGDLKKNDRLVEAMYILLRDYYLPNYGTMPGAKEAASVLKPHYCSIVDSRNAAIKKRSAELDSKYGNRGGIGLFKWGMSEEDVLYVAKQAGIKDIRKVTADELGPRTRNFVGLYSDEYGIKEYRIPKQDASRFDILSGPYLHFYKGKLFAIVDEISLSNETEDSHPLCDKLKKQYPSGKIYQERVKGVPHPEGYREFPIKVYATRFKCITNKDIVFTVQYGLSQFNSDEGVYRYDPDVVSQFKPVNPMDD